MKFTLYLCCLSFSLNLFAVQIKGEEIKEVEKYLQTHKVTTSTKQSIDLGFNKDSGVVVYNFWASWCLPCKKELPSLFSFAKENPKIKVVMINIEDPHKQSIRYLENGLMEMGVPKEISQAYLQYSYFKGSGIRQIPATLVVRNKRIVFFNKGSISFNEKSFLASLYN